MYWKLKSLTLMPLMLWCVLMSSPVEAHSDPVRMGIFTNHRLSRLAVGGNDLTILGYKQGMPDSLTSNYFIVRPGSWGKVVGTLADAVDYDSLVVISASEITVQVNGYRERVYRGRLVCQGRPGYVQPVAILGIGAYFTGVVHAELGKLSHPNLWKAQAIVAHTWLMKNQGKFAHDGFSVTDDVRCQVHHGLAPKERQMALASAIDKVSHLYLATLKDSKPIEALFHANSGGALMPSAWYFSHREYLIAKPDSFSINCPQSEWHRQLSVDEWVKVLATNMGCDIDEGFTEFATSIQQKHRRETLAYQGHEIRLRTIREKFQLRSTWFWVNKVENGMVHLQGKGYGHGIGMSQEGAYHMAVTGHDYLAILAHYYPHTRLLTLKH